MYDYLYMNDLRSPVFFFNLARCYQPRRSVIELRRWSNTAREGLLMISKPLQLKYAVIRAAKYFMQNVFDAKKGISISQREMKHRDEMSLMWIATPESRG